MTTESLREKLREFIENPPPPPEGSLLSKYGVKDFSGDLKEIPINFYKEAITHFQEDKAFVMKLAILLSYSAIESDVESNNSKYSSIFFSSLLQYCLTIVSEEFLELTKKEEPPSKIEGYFQTRLNYR